MLDDVEEDEDEEDELDGTTLDIDDCDDALLDNNDLKLEIYNLILCKENLYFSSMKFRVKKDRVVFIKLFYLSVHGELFLEFY